MFMLTPRSELASVLNEKHARTEQKTKVCETALQHVERQEKEADAAFMEVIDAIRKKQSR